MPSHQVLHCFGSHTSPQYATPDPSANIVSYDTARRHPNLVQNFLNYITAMAGSIEEHTCVELARLTMSPEAALRRHPLGTGLLNLGDASTSGLQPRLATWSSKLSELSTDPRETLYAKGQVIT